MQTKECYRCKEIKSDIEFPKSKRNKDGLRHLCKICNNLTNKQYREENPEQVRLSRKKWKINNPEKVRKNRIKWEQNTLRLKAIRHSVYKKRMLIPRNRLSENIKCLIWHSIKEKKNGRHWEDLLNYTIQDLVAHIEKQFKENMSWVNYGKWHIDHIKAITRFNFKSDKDLEFQECWSLNNLQPLWAEENRRKSNKICQTFSKTSIN